jgi:hypothetical protein
MLETDTKDLALLVLGGVIGFTPWLLDKAEIEMPKRAYVGFLFISVLLVWWALARLNWIGMIPLLRGRTLSLSNTVLACVVVAVLFTIILVTYGKRNKMSEENFGDIPLQGVNDKLFLNETVILDGKSYADCTFQNVTFVFNGTSRFAFSHNRIIGPFALQTDNAAVAWTTIWLKGLGLLGDIPLTAGDKNKPIEGLEPPKQH